MSARCGQPHPENAEVVCDKAEPCYGQHESAIADVDWPGRAVPSRRTAKVYASQVAATAVPQTRTGSPVTAQMASAGLPADSEAAWRRTQGQWLAAAIEALRSTCVESATFTTEQVWARVDNPYERRAMVLVVRHGLRHGWMTKRGTVMVAHDYVTRDGVRFPLNKHVIVYVSRLHQERAPRSSS